MISRRIYQHIKCWSSKKTELKNAINAAYPELWNEQKHLNEGSEHHAYYLYGVYSALVEVVTKLQKKET